MTKLLIIIKHEFKQITKGKLFIIMTLLGPILLSAISFLPSYFAVKSTETEKDAMIAIYSEDSNVIKFLTERLADKNLILIKVENEVKGRQLVIDGDVKGFASIPDNLIKAKQINYYSGTGTDFQYSKEVKDNIRDYIYNLKKAELGLSDKDSKWLGEKVEIKNLKLSDDGNSNDSDYTTVLIISMVISMLIMITALIYGLTSARSILSERSSKTLEILLSSVDPVKILLGKVIGSAAAGLIQFSVWISMIILIAKVAVPAMDINFSFAMLTPWNITIICTLFILGFFFYLLLYTAIGANVENEQSLGQAQMPIQLVLMIPLIISASIISNPNSIFTVILSYLPFTSPTVMSIRLLVDSPGILKVLISITILLVSLIAMLAGSAKLFKIGILTKGKKNNMIQLIKLMFSRQS